MKNIEFADMIKSVIESGFEVSNDNAAITKLADGRFRYRRFYGNAKVAFYETADEAVSTLLEDEGFIQNGWRGVSVTEE